MSLIVAIKTEQGIVMGCDSQVSFGNNKYRLTNDEWPPLTIATAKLNGAYGKASVFVGGSVYDFIADEVMKSNLSDYDAFNFLYSIGVPEEKILYYNNLNAAK